MFEIIVNGRLVQLLEPIVEKDYVLSIRTGMMMSLRVQEEHTKLIADWLFEICQNSEYIIYNQVIMQKEDVQRYTCK